MKSVLYLCTAPPPALNGTDAMFQDIQKLKDRFGGNLINLYPFKKPSRFVPHMLMGMHNRRELQNAMKSAACIHVFSATLKPLPCLHAFDGPVIYTVTASIGDHIRSDWFKNRNITIVVNHNQDAMRLRNLGFNRIENIQPGMDLSHMTFTEPAPTPFTFLVGSAPWTKAQFHTKGIDVLLEAMNDMPDLNLVFLWRNLWHDELLKRIKRNALETRTFVYNRLMNVNEVLANCHASIVLADHNRLVKSWPHSSIESLAAGKPAMLSRVIPMSEFVEEHKAGVAVDSLALSDVMNAIHELRSSYDHLHGSRLQELTKAHFQYSAMIEKYAAIYERIS